MVALPVDPSGLAQARQALAAWLEGNRVVGEHVDDVLIAGNEACMNAVEHSGTQADGKIVLSASLSQGRLEIEIRDGGTWREPVPQGDRGHGLGLMRTLMDSVEILRDDDGTRVAMAKSVDFGEIEEYQSVPGSVTVGEVRGVRVAMMQGEVELASVQGLGVELEAAMVPAGGALVIDLTDVTYLDSAGVHLLFRLAHRHHEAGGMTRLVAGPGPVRRVLELTGIEATMGIDATVDEAIERIDATR